MQRMRRPPELELKGGERGNGLNDHILLVPGHGRNFRCMSDTRHLTHIASRLKLKHRVITLQPASQIRLNHSRSSFSHLAALRSAEEAALL